MTSMVLVYDIPRGDVAVAVKVWRDLNKMGAKKVQHSIWRHGNLDRLIEIAMYIKRFGGSARILEERFVF